MAQLHLYNPRTGKRSRVNRLLRMSADKREDVEVIYSGEIAALVGLKHISTGDTLCDEKARVLLEPPQIRIAVLVLQPVLLWYMMQLRTVSCKDSSCCTAAACCCTLLRHKSVNYRILMLRRNESCNVYRDQKMTTAQRPKTYQEMPNQNFNLNFLT